MKVKDLITKLSEFDGELEVTISDGFEYIFYSTKDIKIDVFEDRGTTTVDIGIGGNMI